MAVIELDQLCETKYTNFNRGNFHIRYATTRSHEKRAHNSLGEDYVIVKIEKDRLTFVVCDGVGGSFFGGLAAQIVGEELTKLFWEPYFQTYLIKNQKTDSTILLIKDYLESVTKRVSKYIDRNQSPSNKFVQQAFESKRRDFGSQTNFVSGALVLPNKTYPQGIVHLFWLGNSKLDIWSEEGILKVKPICDWNSDDVWSSKFGVLGNIYGFRSDLSKIDGLLAYTDGLRYYEKQIIPKKKNNEIDQIIEKASKEDDVSLLEISYNRKERDYKNDISTEIRNVQFVNEKANYYSREILKKNGNDFIPKREKIKELDDTKIHQISFKKNVKVLFITCIICLLFSSSTFLLGFFIRGNFMPKSSFGTIDSTPVINICQPITFQQAGANPYKLWPYEGKNHPEGLSIFTSIMCEILMPYYYNLPEK